MVQKSDFIVGQQWWFVPKEKRNSPRWITVTAVGNKLIKFVGTDAYVDVTECEGDVIKIRTKDYGGVGRLFKTRAEHEHFAGMFKRKERFYHAVSSFHYCTNLSDEQVIEAAKILGIDLEKS